MARIFPENAIRPFSQGFHRGELATLAWLQRRLPDEYAIFHALPGSLSHHGGGGLTGVDFVVVNAAGKALLVKQNNGELRETGQGLIKDGGDGRQNVAAQIQQAMVEVRGRFDRCFRSSRPLEVDFLLYCPNYKIKDLGAVGVDPVHVVDAASAQCLATRIARLLESSPPMAASGGQSDAVFQYFQQSFDLVPNIHVGDATSAQRFTRLGEGLIDVLNNFSMRPYRLRIRGVSGSGKSYAACHAYRQAVAAHKNTVLLAASPVLVARMARLLPGGGRILSFAQLAEQVVRDDHTAVDCLIVDDGEHFPIAHRDLLKRVIDDSSDVIWFENERCRPDTERVTWAPAHVTYRCCDNFRTPQRIARWLRRVTDVPVNFQNRSSGRGVLVQPYEDAAQQRSQVERAVRKALASGFRADEIVVLHFSGDNAREDSARAEVSGVASMDLDRFHGCEAPVVIVTGVDPQGDAGSFEERLYLAATRASVSLQLLVKAGNPLIEKRLLDR